MKRIYYPLFLLLALTSVNPPGSANAVTLTFENQALGQVYYGGSRFESSGLGIDVNNFITAPLPVPLSGEMYDTLHPYSFGKATITDSGLAGGSGNEIELDNIILDFDIDQEVAGASLNFGGQSGLGYISINNESRIISSLYELVGQTIGGVEINIAVADSIAGPDAGLLQIMSFFGSIKQLSIGGSGFSLDNIYFRDSILAEVPEPASLLLLASGIFGLGFSSIRRRGSF